MLRLSFVSMLIFIHSSFAVARIDTALSYELRQLFSHELESPTFSGFNLSAMYALKKPSTKVISILMGSQLYLSDFAWRASGSGRVGFLTEMAFSTHLQYVSKRKLSFHVGASVPLYSKAISGGGMSMNTDTGRVESVSKTEYKGAGYNFEVGGDVIFKNSKVMGTKTDIGGNWAIKYLSRTFDAVECTMVSSKGDYSGACEKTLLMQGFAYEVGMRVRLD